MTPTLVARGGPSEAHERRAETLTAMATLSGHTIALDRLYDGTRPDVLQLRPRDSSLFIGDAKATETPGNDETIARLTRYSIGLRPWVAGGSPAIFALIVPEMDGHGWLRLLRGLVAPLAADPRAGRLDVIEPGTALAWYRFDGALH